MASPPATGRGASGYFGAQRADSRCRELWFVASETAFWDQGIRVMFRAILNEGRWNGMIQGKTKACGHLLRAELELRTAAAGVGNGSRQRLTVDLEIADISKTWFDSTRCCRMLRMS